MLNHNYRVNNLFFLDVELRESPPIKKHFILLKLDAAFRLAEGIDHRRKKGVGSQKPTPFLYPYYDSN